MKLTLDDIYTCFLDMVVYKVHYDNENGIYTIFFGQEGRTELYILPRLNFNTLTFKYECDGILFECGLSECYELLSLFIDKLTERVNTDKYELSKKTIPLVSHPPPIMGTPVPSAPIGKSIQFAASQSISMRYLKDSTEELLALLKINI